MYAEYTQPQLTFLALNPCVYVIYCQTFNVKSGLTDPPQGTYYTFHWLGVNEIFTFFKLSIDFHSGFSKNRPTDLCSIDKEGHLTLFRINDICYSDCESDIPLYKYRVT